MLNIIPANQPNDLSFISYSFEPFVSCIAAISSVSYGMITQQIIVTAKFDHEIAAVCIWDASLPDHWGDIAGCTKLATTTAPITGKSLE